MQDNLHFLPIKLREKLMPFQKEGILYALNKNGRCLIADEMGLGKTIQAISVAYFYKDDWPLLIIVPSSLRYPWIEEVERWLPEINPREINLIQGGADVGGINSSSITVVTYGLLRHPASKIVREALCSQKFKVMVVDESHYLKNRKSATSKYLVPLLQNAERLLLLTGTPALARPEELFPQLSALLPKDFPAFGTFAKKYCNAHHQFFGRIRKWVTDGASNLGELQNLLISKVMIRRLKKDVLKQLPPKQRQRIPFDVKESDLKKDLDTTWNEFHSVLDQNKTAMSKVLENNDSDVPAGSSTWFEIRKNMSKLYHQTCFVKLGPVKDYVKMLCENQGLKFIIFAYHHVMMDSIADQLHDGNIKYIRIDGSTLQQDRPRLVHQFQIDKPTRVAVLSIKAAGVGLTLTSANLVVFAELDWTPGAMEQCEDRAHRIGQKDTVHVHYLVAKGTLDDWVWAALARKTSIVTTTLNGKTQVLNMDVGNKGQIDCLANADAYKPAENLHEDISDFFKSQQAKDQKTMFDFFTPTGQEKKKKDQTRNKKKVNIEPIMIDDFDETNTSLDEFKTPIINKRKKKEKQNSMKYETEKNSPVSKTHSRKHKSNKLKEIVSKKEVQSKSDEEDHTNLNSDSLIISTHDISRSSSTESLHIETSFVMDNINDECETDQLALQFENDSDQTQPEMEKIVLNPNPKTVCTNVKLFVTDEFSQSITAQNCRSDVQDDIKLSTAVTGNIIPNLEIRDSELSESTWSCTACTFQNHFELPYCEMCNTCKPKSKRNPQQTMSTVLSDRTAIQRNKGTTGGKKSRASKMLLSPTTPPSTGVIGKKENLTPEREIPNPLISKLKHAMCSQEIKTSSSHEIGRSKYFTVSSTSNNRKSTHRSDDKSTNSAFETEFSNVPIINENDVEDLGIGRYDSDAELFTSNSNSPVITDYACNPSPIIGNALGAGVSGPHLNENKSEDGSIDGIDIENVSSGEELPDLCVPKRVKKNASPVDSPKSNKESSSDDQETNQTICVADDFQSGDCVNSQQQYLLKSSQELETNLVSNTPVALRNPGSVNVTPLNLNENNTPESSQMCTSSQQSELMKTPTTGTKSTDDMIAEETMAARLLFSPSRKDSKNNCETYSGAGQWICLHCDMLNDEDVIDCDGCLESRPTHKELQTQSKIDQKTTERKVNLDEIPVYSLFKYCSSQNTSRIYLYDQDDNPLTVNFVPLDIEVGNYAELPDVLLHPDNLRLVQRFVREWNSLTATKRRVLVRSGELFISPCLTYEQVRSKPKNVIAINSRLLTREENSIAAKTKAEEIGGSVRLITRPVLSPKKKKRKRNNNPGETEEGPSTVANCSKDIRTSGESKDGGASIIGINEDPDENADKTIMENIQGVTQVLDSLGNALCLQCNNPYTNALITAATIVNNPWQTRFCSRDCMHEYWVRSSRSYGVDLVFSEEHGVCQICGFEAHQFFLRIKNTADVKKRALLIKESIYNILVASQKERMVKKPTKGLFWEVDHINPVSLGGGQCDIDNLRTLCTPCHRHVTSQQSTDRAKRRKLEKAAACGDITAFFKPN